MAVRVPLLLALGALLALGMGCKKTGAPEAPVMAPVVEAPPPPPPPPDVDALVANFNRVYFEYDSASLTEPTMRALDDNVRIMQEHPDIRIEIQGHADERGTTDYNLALGQRRASTVSRYMGSVISQTGRLKVVSYGEERPIDQSVTERAFSQNRRCEFRVVYSAADAIGGTVN